MSFPKSKRRRARLRLMPAYVSPEQAFDERWAGERGRAFLANPPHPAVAELAAAAGLLLHPIPLSSLMTPFIWHGTLLYRVGTPHEWLCAMLRRRHQVERV